MSPSARSAFHVVIAPSVRGVRMRLCFMVSLCETFFRNLAISPARPVRAEIEMKMRGVRFVVVGAEHHVEEVARRIMRLVQKLRLR